MPQERLQEIETRYLGQSITDFILEGGEINEYAALVFNREIFGSDDPAAPDLEIHTQADLTAALEELLDAVAVTIRTNDPYTRGEVYGEGPDPIDSVTLPVSLDADEWELQAARDLLEQGYQVAGPWIQSDPAGIEARAVIDMRSCDEYYPPASPTGPKGGDV